MNVGFCQRAAVALVVAVSVGGCGGEPSGGSSRPDGDRSADPRPNVLLVSLDTLRADFAAEAPFLSRLAAEGRSFGNAYASSNWTLPAHVSLFTSLPYAVHNLPPPRSPAPYERTRIPDAWPTLARALGDAGFFTAATTEGGWLHPRFGVASGFDRFERSSPLLHGGAAVLSEHLRLARELIGEAAGRPVFLFAHTYWVHDYFVNSEEYHGLLTADDAPYAALGNLLDNVASEDRPAVPPGFVRRLYTAGVRRADRFVEELVAAVRQATGDVPWLVIVTSDHGESLGERDLWGHGGSLDDEQIRIPLIVRCYGGDGLGGRVDRPVSTIDLAPSLLAWLGLEPAPGFLGSPDLFADRVPPQRTPIFTRFFLHRAERPWKGEVRQASIHRGTRYQRADHFDGSLASESCSGADAGPSAEPGAGASGDPPCAALRDAYERIRSRGGFRSVELRASEPVRLTFDRAPDAVPSAQPLLGADAPLVEPDGRITFSPADHGALFLYPSAGDVVLRRVEVGGETLAEDLRLSELAPDADGVRRWAASTPSGAEVSLVARGLGSGGFELPRAARDLVDRLRALGYLGRD